MQTKPLFLALVAIWAVTCVIPGRFLILGRKNSLHSIPTILLLYVLTIYYTHRRLY